VGDDDGTVVGAADGIGVGVPALNVGAKEGVLLGALDGEEVGWGVVFPGK